MIKIGQYVKFEAICNLTGKKYLVEAIIVANAEEYIKNKVGEEREYLEAEFGECGPTAWIASDIKTGQNHIIDETEVIKD
jgi:hypothetical protein